VEFPFMTVPPNSQEVLARLREGGWTPVLAHPERYAGVDSISGIARVWREAGAVLQVNAGSLLGCYGDPVRRRATALLEWGCVGCIASDYHARGRVRVADVAAFLAAQGAAEQGELLMKVNPKRILDGKPPIPVAPVRLRRSGFWERLARLGGARRRVGP